MTTASSTGVILEQNGQTPSARTILKNLKEPWLHNMSKNMHNRNWVSTVSLVCSIDKVEKNMYACTRLQGEWLFYMQEVFTLI